MFETATAVADPEEVVADPEEVVLLNPRGQPIGRAAKAEIHGARTPLHLAFSIFLFDDRGRMLMQQRAWSKQTWPGIWSNACCGHPMPGEPLAAAARRRLREELGLKDIELHLALPHFRYRASHAGVEENEICPVFAAYCDREPEPNPEEVAATRWIDWQTFLQEEADTTKLDDPDFSPWSRLEAAALKGTIWGCEWPRSSGAGSPAGSPSYKASTGKNQRAFRFAEAPTKRVKGSSIASSERR